METLRSVSQPLANARREVVDNIGTRIAELSESLKTLADPLTPGRLELTVSISGRITELTDMLDNVVKDSPKASKP